MCPMCTARLAVLVSTFKLACEVFARGTKVVVGPALKTKSFTSSLEVEDSQVTISTVMLA